MPCLHIIMHMCVIPSLALRARISDAVRGSAHMQQRVPKGAIAALRKHVEFMQVQSSAVKQPQDLASIDNFGSQNRG